MNFANPKENPVKILVAVKQVMDVELNIRVKEGRVLEDGMNYVLSKWDENAVEAALRIKADKEADVVVVSVGPEKSTETLRRALAMGADTAFLISDPEALKADSLGVARILAKAALKEGADLVITGLQAQDSDQGGVGPMLAELLGWPSAINVVKVEGPQGNTLTLQRRGDNGVEVVEMQLPALISANDSLNEPRLVGLPGIMKAKKKPLETLTLADLGLKAADVAPRMEVVEVLPPPQRAAGKKFEGEPEETVRQLMDALTAEAKLFG